MNQDVPLSRPAYKFDQRKAKVSVAASPAESDSSAKEPVAPEIGCYAVASIGMANL
jgi:hypothetical protein